MTPEQFVYWMKGMVASLNEGPPHAMAWATILDELKKVERRQWPMPYVPPQTVGPLNPNPLAPPYIVTCNSGEPLGADT